MVLNGREAIHEAFSRKSTDFAGKKNVFTIKTFQTKFLEGVKGDVYLRVVRPKMLLRIYNNEFKRNSEKKR